MNKNDLIDLKDVKGNTSATSKVIVTKDLLEDIKTYETEKKYKEALKSLSPYELINLLPLNETKPKLEEVGPDKGDIFSIY